MFIFTQVVLQVFRSALMEMEACFLICISAMDLAGVK